MEGEASTDCPLLGKPSCFIIQWPCYGAGHSDKMGSEFGLERPLRFTEHQLRALSDYQSWKEGEDGPATLLDYAAYTATPDQLFAYAALFFRELVEVDGHYYFADEFDAAVYERAKAELPDGRDVQRRLNALAISRVLQSADVDDAAAKSCAMLIAAAWNALHADEGVTAEVHGETLENLVVTLVNGHE